jgi:transposase
MSQAALLSTQAMPSTAGFGFETTVSPQFHDNRTITLEDLENAKKFSSTSVNNQFRALEAKIKLRDDLICGLLSGEVTRDDVLGLISLENTSSSPEAQEDSKQENIDLSSTKIHFLKNLLSNDLKNDTQNRLFTTKALGLLENLTTSLTLFIRHKEDFLEVNDDSKQAAENLINSISDIFGKIKKTSKNSSKEPSSEKFKPKKTDNNGPEGKSRNGKPGGKKGHEGHCRPELTEEDADKVINVPLSGKIEEKTSEIAETTETIKSGENQTREVQKPEMSSETLSKDPLNQESADSSESSPQETPEDCCCPHCQSKLERAPEKDERIEQLEIPPVLIQKILYIILGYWCPNCKTFHKAEKPDELKTGLLGPNLITLITLLKSSCHASYGNIKKLVNYLGGGDVCKATLDKAVTLSAESVAPAVEELEKKLPETTETNLDATGHKENGKNLCTWAFVTSLFTLFKITVSCTAKDIKEMLGLGYRGIIGCDYHSAHKKYLKDSKKYKAEIGDDSDTLVQFCWAHLKRDVQAIIDSYVGNAMKYGLHLMDLEGNLFKLYHEYLKDLSNFELFSRLEACGKEFIRYAIEAAPDYRKCQNLAKRLKENGDGYLTFIYNLNIAPTNNSAEQSIRYVVIDRLVTQGTRSEKGRKNWERLWSVMATCAKQKISPHEFFKQSISAYCKGERGPSLIQDE